MIRDYYLGLDMGTGSVGWAVTDRSYCLCRAHGKDLWGVRLFESANTAEERRQFRCNRRRLDRRNQRIQWLQEIFAEEIAKVDPGFFLRLKESRYVPEDKRDLEGRIPLLPYSLFVDKNYTDKNFHKEYPTIYHLRKELLSSKEPKDVRLVYLALHHIIKHRGHFLFAGIEAEKVTDFSAAFKEFVKRVQEEELDFNIVIDEEKADKVKNILESTTLTKSAKASRLIAELHANEKCEKALLKLITGCKVKLSEIFNKEEYDDCEKTQISFAEAAYEDYVAVVEEELAEQFVVIAAARAIYDWSVLVNILDGEQNISEAKVKIYEKHRKDLQYLKKLVKTYLTRDDYRKIFVVPDAKYSNYCAYIGMTKINGKKVSLEGKMCSKEDFYGFLRKEVCNKLADNEETAYLKNEIELGTFLPRQVSKDNGVIPYQLQLKELKAILKNASKYLPCVAENAEKIEQLMTFRVPYYVGPLNVVKENQVNFAWAVRRSNEKIYPWTFGEVIDEEASAEQFIRRMTNKCTYLVGEDVLPKDSLLYSKFMVLNELNNLRINGEKISVAMKQQLYEELFQRYRKVTMKKLRQYLEKEGVIDKVAEITGVDGDFKASLRAYHDFKEKLTGVELSRAQKEELILNITLFGDDKVLLKKRVKKLFPELTEKQIKAVCTLGYKGWGRLSKRFLEDITTPDLETGEACSIMRMLWETNDNLMQLLSNKYQFIPAIEEINGSGQTEKITYEVVEKMYVSPAVKRQIWQTLQIVDELQKVMKGAPERVFLEVAREKTDTGRTLSRKRLLQDLYKNCKEEERNWIEEIETKDEHSFKSDRLYLYYTQKGCCMYCGKKIDLQDLWDANMYDIDHIYPQSKVMDDSIRNRVLTCRTCNAKKTDEYPLRSEIRQKMQPFWKGLFVKKLIDEEKYKRLTRSEEFSADELAGFIERQLVETRQSTKAVAEILRQVMPETEIVYVKAKTVSAFRQDFGFIKVRELNDYHHAKDAYLNIVVGNTYFVKFTKDAARYIAKNPGRSYNLKKMFTSGDVVSGNEVAWKSGENGTIKNVRKVMSKNSVLVTRKSYEVQGGLFKQQIVKKGKGQVPIKGSDVRLQNIEKYGGYDKATGAYFMLVESLDKKGNLKRTLEYIPLYRKVELENDAEDLNEYLLKECDLKEPRVILKKIKADSLFSVDGFKMHLSGRTGKQLIFKGANQLVVGEEQKKVLKKIVKIVNQLKENKNYKINNYDAIKQDELEKLYDLFLAKLTDTLYGKRFEAQIQTLSAGKEQFLKLLPEEKCRVLYEILHLFQCQSAAANLSAIGGPGHAGILVLNNEISSCNDIKLINQSPTGIFEQVIDLKTV